MENVTKKWMPIIETIKQTIRNDELQKLTPDEKIYLYAEYHTLNETISFCNEGNFMGATISSNITKDPKLNSTLPVSLKILTRFGLENDMKKVYIIPAPKYDIPFGKCIQVGDIHFDKSINKNSIDLQSTIDKIIYDEMIKYFIKNCDKIIYIYMIVQSVRIVENSTDGGSTLKWTSRIAFED